MGPVGAAGVSTSSSAEGGGGGMLGSIGFAGADDGAGEFGDADAGGAATG